VNLGRNRPFIQGLERRDRVYLAQPGQGGPGRGECTKGNRRVGRASFLIGCWHGVQGGLKGDRLFRRKTESSIGGGKKGGPFYLTTRGDEKRE